MKFAKFLRTPFYRTPPVAVSGNKSSILIILQATFFIKKTEIRSPVIFAAILKKLYSTKPFSDHILLQNVFQQLRIEKLKATFQFLKEKKKKRK